jgi:N-acetylglucosamine-6-sulfatase
VRMQPHTNASHVSHIVLVLAAMVMSAIALGALLVTGDEQRTEAQSVSRPNIVFVMTDDLDERSIEDLDSFSQLMGGTNGTTFENAYVTYSLCCPSRATILRGQYPHNHTILGNLPKEGGGEQKFRDLGLDKSTMATWLDDAGYRTSYIGKYMNGYGFGDLYIPPGWDEWFVLNGRGPRDPYVNDNGQTIRITGNSTDVFATETSDFILRSSENPEPFFVVVGTHAPHNPPAVAERYQGAFADTPLPQPLNFNEEDISDKPQWLQQYPRLSQEQIDALEQLYRERLRSMLAVEDLLEQIIDTLHQTGDLDNTYIFFTSDNGYHYGHHRLYPDGKQTPYEEDIGVPLMVRGPRVLAGEIRKQLILNNDFAPTIADLAHVTTPGFVDGRSFAPLLTGSSPYASRSAFLEEGWLTEEGRILTPTHKSTHTRDHMFIEYVDTGEHELYDLVADPFQLQSMTQADNPQLYSTLQTRLNKLRACSRAICRANEWDTQVISTIPKANATAVAPTANVTATFSEDMMASSITAKSFKLLEKGSTTKIGATVTYDTTTDTATLDPTGSLKSGVSYKAVVTTGAKDVAGNPLDQNTTTAGLQHKAWFFAVIT